MLNRTRKAFTLLELMVAFVIMAILAAVAIPSLQSIVANSQLQADQSSALNIAHAAYFNAQSVYPAVSPTIIGTTLSDYAGQITATGDGSMVSVALGSAPSTTNAWFTFTDGDGVCVTVPSASSGYPSLTSATTSTAC